MGVFIRLPLGAFSQPNFLTCVCVLYTCVHVDVGRCVRVYASVWRPQLNSGWLSQLFSSIVFETGFCSGILF